MSLLIQIQISDGSLFKSILCIKPFIYFKSDKGKNKQNKQTKKYVSVWQVKISQIKTVFQKENNNKEKINGNVDMPYIFIGKNWLIKKLLRNVEEIMLIQFDKWKYFNNPNK